MIYPEDHKKNDADKTILHDEARREKIYIPCCLVAVSIFPPYPWLIPRSTSKCGEGMTLITF